MKKLLAKEFRFSGQTISYIFVLFSLMTFLPGYPILCGAFFLCLGIYFSFQAAREGGDALFTVLLPIRKSDAVKARFLWVCTLQLAGFVLDSAFTALRMALLNSAEVYAGNVMMNSNLYFLGFVLLIFAVFNSVFVRMFWRDAVSLGKPFILTAVLVFVIIAIAETLHHIPGLEFMNENRITLAQAAFMLVCAFVYCLGTYISCKASQKSFEQVQL